MVRERASGSGTEVASVYVHAPFCARRCQYCDFAVQVRKDADPGVWLDALERERALLDDEGVFRLAGRLDTLYVGGGTPSLFGVGAMAGLARVVGHERLEAPGLEWTAEANPESFTTEVAEDWRAAGVNRVSLGVQSFHEPALRWMGRLHGPAGAGRAVSIAQRVGFPYVSVDLIFGLPERTGRSWSEDLSRVIDLGVPHVSLYGLTVEAGTPLGRSVAEGRVDLPDEDRYRAEYLEAAERLTGAGWVHYEVSNFARPGHESLHNQVYWSGDAYLGLGNGAHGYAHPLRRWNLRDWNAYERSLREGRLRDEGQETLDASAHRLERLWLQLRTRRGILWAALESAGREMARSWEARGLASISERVQLTASGWLVMDRLTVELDARLEGQSESRPARRILRLGEVEARKGGA
jgi:oxygen-independent coproporphyrinogen-3 oxidase